MYEISLVPDVKAELIKKLKLRNLVVLICIIVAGACAGVIAVLFSVTAGQGLTLSAQDTEMTCRSEGKAGKSGKCDAKYGTAISRFPNASEYLTIQDQMKNLSILNQNKLKYSRIFGILDVVLPVGENTVQISELNSDIVGNRISFDAVAFSANNIGYRALEAFKKNATRAYFDYGSYMRHDSETDEDVAIPSYCIDEETDSNGIIFGVYHQGKPGCEAPMVIEEEEEKDEKPEDEKTEEEKVLSEEEAINKVAEDAVKVKDIRIRRTYTSKKDMEEYRNGNDSYNNEDGKDIVKGYYFDSKCIEYGEDDKVDGEASLAKCPLLTEEPSITDSSYGKDSEDKMVLSFSASLTLSHDVFLSKNKHVKIIGPSRQNVTDSYIQIRDMFVKPVDSNGEGEN